MNEKTYLGDGVYATTERGMIKLTTEDGAPGVATNTIFLELEVYVALVAWATQKFGTGVRP